MSQIAYRFPCHIPQPRVVPVSELIHPHLHPPGRVYYPESTVLHRCSSSTGCCTEGGVCGPVHFHTVHLAFRITSLDDPHPMDSNPWHLEYLPALNHTLCGCSKEGSPVMSRSQGLLL